VHAVHRKSSPVLKDSVSADQPAEEWSLGRALARGLIASHRGIRLQVASKSLYLKLDELSPKLLDYFYTGKFCDEMM
jgi:hypothetical protein